MRRHRFRLASALALAACATACTSGRGPVVSAPRAAGFDAARSIDVSSQGQPPPVDAPEHLAAAGSAWPDDALVLVPMGARLPVVAYPLETLARRPIINDTVGATPIVVVFSPLTKMIEVLGRAATMGPNPVQGLSFTTAGKLYQSEVVMADRRTKSLWLGSSGRAVAGELTGATLQPIPAVVVDFKTIRAIPGAQVIADPSPGAPVVFAGYGRRVGPLPDLFKGAIDSRLPALAQVLGVVASGARRAYPLARLPDPGAVTDGSTVVFRRGNVAVAFDATLDGAALTFSVRGREFVDDRSHSVWSVLGIAQSGPMRAHRLVPRAQTQAYWFAWASEQTSIWGK